jgi:genome maintenance exonuclease 1
VSFDYLDYPTVDVSGKRVYQISDEKYYPSITTVLGHTLLAEKSKYLEAWKARVGAAKANQITNDAAARGTNTHLMLERHLKGEVPFKEGEFPEAHVNVFKSLRLELRKINKVYGQEVVLFSDLLGVAGRCDLIAEYQGALAVVDYKTSSRIKNKDEIGDYWLQATFYAIAHNEMFGTNIEKLVIMMGVENHLPMIFRKNVDDELLLQLSERVSKFYSNL